MKKLRKTLGKGFQPLSIQEKEMIVRQTFQTIGLRIMADRLHTLDPSKSSDEWLHWAMKESEEKFFNITNPDELKKLF